MSYKQSRQVTAFLVIFAVGIVQVACGPNSNADQSATVEALANALSLTGTASALEDLSSDEKLATAQAEATEQAKFAAETQAAAAELNAEEQAATATAVAPILAELPVYGVDPSQGKTAWIHPPFTLELDGYLETAFENQFMATVVKDFVISTDITWNTRYGSNGCGFIMRSDGNQENPNHYMVGITRFGEGRAIFLTLANGQLANGVDMYIPFYDPTFSWQNDATNRLTVVAQERVFKVYANGVLLREITTGEEPVLPRLPTTPPTPENPEIETAMDQYLIQLEQHQQEVEDIQTNFRARLGAYRNYNTIFERGFVAMAVLSEAGKTTCSFDNTWLWVFNE